MFMTVLEPLPKIFQKELEKEKRSCPEAWASGLLLCPLMCHLQHFALEPVFAGIKKRNRAVRSLHARGYPPATPPTFRRDPNGLMEV